MDANVLNHRDRIGPNAIIQVIASVTDRMGRAAAVSLFESAGLGHYIEERPQDMVSEADVALLQTALHARYGLQLAKEISRNAGLRTGDYLLAHRIPWLAQTVVKRLPAAWAARILAKAIGKHSWTFAGSGSFSVQPGQPFIFTIRHNPICSQLQSEVPVCDFYAATFERIFRAIVHPQAHVTETECEATGAPACVFQVCW